MEPQRTSISSTPTLIDRIDRFVHHPRFTATILVLILFNAILLGLETYPSIYEPYQNLFHGADQILLWLFTLEVILKIIAARPWYRFFKDGWNVFDLLIIASGHLFADVQFVVVLRILRVLRVLRAISILPALRRLVKTLLATIPSLGNIGILLGIIFYIFSVIGTMLFRDVAPEYFGSMHLSMLSLFQIVTLESWASGIMWPIQQEKPWAWIYFVSFVLVGTFVILNLFIGVIVNKVDQVAAEEEELEKLRKEADLQREVRHLRDEIRELKTMMERPHSPPSEEEKADRG
ncbi:ion transporter [Desmospora profundinema]|uniref:Voltage-gated sodium channel n=1 Tax=Desmospora profundinema TaxID=1571184 RepID=A0ABU1IK64_9BACL|nr:ion transporter [Desmospora profundinema]MDR6225165.1 voltage-gated sodium channel [Desmospora profundinema]